LILLVALSWRFSRRKGHHGPAGDRWHDRVGAFAIVRIVGIVVIMAGLIVGVLWLGGDRMGEKGASASDVVDGITRKQIWHSTWELIKQNPWTGVGFGNYFLAIPEYQTGAGRIKLEQAHNDYLDLTANGGIVAVALTALFVAVVVWRGASSLRSPDRFRRAAALGASAAIASVAVHSLVDFGLQITGIAVVFAALVVIVIADQVEQPASFGTGFPFSQTRD